MTLSNATDILLLNILYITSLHKAIEINGFHAAADAADAAEAAEASASTLSAAAAAAEAAAAAA